MLLTPGTLCELWNAPSSDCRRHTTSHCCYCLFRPNLIYTTWPALRLHSFWKLKVKDQSQWSQKGRRAQTSLTYECPVHFFFSLFVNFRYFVPYTKMVAHQLMRTSSLSQISYRYFRIICSVQTLALAHTKKDAMKQSIIKNLAMQ